VCRDWGACAAKNGLCVAASDENCRKAWICTLAGRCTAQADQCAAATDADCRGAELCKVERKCTAENGWCIRQAGEEKRAGKDKPDRPGDD
jgi:hypothetical protein